MPNSSLRAFEAALIKGAGCRSRVIHLLDERAGERVCLNVKRWQCGDQRERWVGSGLLVAQEQFRRIKGWKQIPLLLTELQSFVSRNSNLAKRRKAS